MKQVTIRVELRVYGQMNEFLATQAQARKLSEERMNAQRDRVWRRAR